MVNSDKAGAINRSRDEYSQQYIKRRPRGRVAMSELNAIDVRLEKDERQSEQLEKDARQSVQLGADEGHSVQLRDDEGHSVQLGEDEGHSVPLEKDEAQRVPQAFQNGLNIPEKKRSAKNIAHEHLTTLAHACIVVFSLYLIYKSLAGYLGVFTMHPLFYAIGWMFLMTEAVMLFSKDSIFSSKMDRARRIRLHWIFQTTGLVLSTIAFFAAFVFYDINNHFTTWHGLLGLIAMILCYLACANGAATLYCMELRAYISPKLNKIFHTGTGIATVFIGAVTMVLSLYTNWFNYYIEKNPDVFFICFVIVLCGLMWSIVRPSVNLFRRVKSS